MSEVTRTLDQLHRAYEGPAWHGPALREILDGVTWETAALHPIPGAHSIWELVLHITAWITVPTHRIEGAVIPTISAQHDWPAPPTPSEAAWQQTLEQLSQAQQSLETVVAALPDERLRDKILGEVPYSIYATLHGVTQHILYHAGQIALLKKAAVAF